MTEVHFADTHWADGERAEQIAHRYSTGQKYITFSFSLNFDLSLDPQFSGIEHQILMILASF